HIESMTRAGQLVEAADDHRHRRRRLLDHFAAIVEQAANSAIGAAHEDDVADFQRAILDENSGDSAQALIHARFNDHAAGRSIEIGFQLEQFRLVVKNFDQLFDAFAGDSAGADDFDV